MDDRIDYHYYWLEGKEIQDADNIIFDFGGVIMKHNMTECRNAFREFMSDRDIYKVLGLGNNEDENTLIAQYNRGMSTSEWLQKVLKYCKEGTRESDIIIAWQMLHDCVLDETWEQIRNLRYKGYRTYLLTNTNELHWADTVLRYNKQLRECFDGIYCSFIWKLNKPDMEIYQLVDKAIGADPERTIFVDDSEVNRDAAEEFAGWETCWDIKSLLSAIEIHHIADELLEQFRDRRKNDSN